MTMVKLREVFKDGYVDDKDNYYVSLNGQQVCEIRPQDWDDDRYRILGYNNNDISHTIPFQWGDTLLDVSRLVDLSANVLSPDEFALVVKDKYHFSEYVGEEDWESYAYAVRDALSDHDSFQNYISVVMQHVHEQGIRDGIYTNNGGTYEEND